MGAIVVIGAFAVLVAVKEIPALRQQRSKRELWVFLLLLFLATGLNIAYFFRLPLKNPTEWIYAGYKPVSDFFLHYLQ